MAWRHGDVTKVKTDGASFITAGLQDGYHFDGVAYSHKMAADDLDAVNKYRSIIVSVGRDKRVDPAVIAGIISRESSGGETIKPNNKHNNPVGSGDNGNGFGLMQVDKLKGKRILKGAWDSEEHLKQATDILLIESIEEIHKKFRKWNKEQQLKGGLAAYNAGVIGVSRYRKGPGRGSSWDPVDDSYTGDFDSDFSYSAVDSNTTGRDYSSDVVARAQWYKKHGHY